MISFKPLSLLRNCHLQTIVSSILSFKNSLKQTEEIILIPMKDGDRIQTKTNINTQSKKVAFLVHGLEGSSDARYMIQTSSRLFSEGYSTIRINLRNCGGTENLSQSLYNAGMSDDLETVLNFFKSFDFEETYLIGFSLGANLIGKYVGEKGNQIDSKIKRVVLISPPLDLNKTLIRMSKGFNWFYNYHFTYLLKAKYLKKCQAHPHVFDRKILKKIKNLKNFDDLITGPYFGFKDALDYYEWGSSIKYIENVKVPVFILQAKDDPIVDSIDHQELLQSSSEFIKVILTDKGGHVGFYGYGNGNKKANSWLEQTISQLIK